MKIRSVILILSALLLIAVCGCAPKTPSIVNGGFDDGIAGWTENFYYDGISTASSEHDADHGSTAFISSASDNDARLIQELEVSGNTVYRIVCDVKTEEVSGEAGANIGVYGVAVTGGTVTGTTDWHEIELVGKTAPCQKVLPVSVGIGGHGSLASGKAWFDNVRIELAEDARTDTMFGKASSNTPKKIDAPNEFPTGKVVLTALYSTVFFLLILTWHRTSARKPLKKEKKTGAGYAALILVGAFLLRLALAIIALETTKLGGHKTDINCFTAWGMRVANNGAARFYEQWCDYPPGYMLVLGAIASLSNALGLDYGVYIVLVKTPSILCDIACAWLIWRYSVKSMSRSAALSLTAVVAFTPVMAYVSAYWGQIDQLLALLLIVPILLLYKRRPILAGLFYGLAIAMKPQALMCGPMFVAACIIYIISGDRYDNPFASRSVVKLLKIKKDTVGLRVFEVLAAMIGALLLIILLSLPFKGEQEPFWLLDKYIGTATSYKYATVNGYNFWALIGANWKSVDEPFLGLTYGKWGTVFMVFFIAAGIALYAFASIKHRNAKGALPLSMAYSLAGIFTFGHYMHERYIFPALMLIMFAYVFYNDRRLIWTYAAYAVTTMVNCLAAFYYSELFEYGLYWDKRIIFWCSLANVAVFALFTVLVAVLMIGNKPKKAYNG
ncbi:MAG: DUF2029 domain-containing protein [Clostridia bacterium]|nr:DUF2029 domain-containing protein [Clostridia bacterium]